MDETLASSITGRPSERRVLGETGWVEVTTTTGLKYYVCLSTKETTWLCPPAAAVWIAQNASNRSVVPKPESAFTREDTEEQKREEWVIEMIDAIKRLKIPPIMTYDRAIKRLETEKKMLEKMPEDERQNIFERARKSILTKKPGSLLTQFQEKVKSLDEAGKLRAEQIYEDVCQLFFHDPKWANVIHRKAAVDFVEERLKIQREALQTEIANLAPTFSQICKRGFGEFVADKLGIGSAEDSTEKLRAFLSDNEAIASFASGARLAEFRVWLRDNLRGSEEVTVFGTFASHCDEGGLEELIADAWQSWFQETWELMEKGEAVMLRPPAPLEAEAVAKSGRAKRKLDCPEEVERKRLMAPTENKRALIQAENERRRKEQLASIMIGEKSKDPYRCLPDEIFRWKSLSPTDAKEINLICFEALIGQLQEDPRWPQLGLRLRKTGRGPRDWRLDPCQQDSSGEDTPDISRSPSCQTEEKRGEARQRHESPERSDSSRRDRDRRQSGRDSRPDRREDRGHSSYKRDDLRGQKRVENESHRSDSTYRSEAKFNDKRQSRNESHKDYATRPAGQKRVEFGDAELRRCFRDHISQWERQAHESFKMLMGKFPDLPLQTSYSQIAKDERFDRSLQKTPRWLVEQWLEEAERERRVDLLDSLSTFLRRSTILSEVMRKLPPTATIESISSQVKLALEEEITWTKLRSAPSLRDEVVRRAVEGAAADRIRGRLITQKVMEEKRRYDELKESVKSEMDQRDMDKRMLMNDNNGVAVEEEDLVLQGVDEDI